MILADGHRLLFAAITDIHVGRATEQLAFLQTFLNFNIRAVKQKNTFYGISAVNLELSGLNYFVGLTNNSQPLFEY